MPWVQVTAISRASTFSSGRRVRFSQLARPSSMPALSVSLIASNETSGVSRARVRAVSNWLLATR